MKKLRSIMIGFVLVCIVALSFIAVRYSNFTGYCKEEGRHLTEEELIQRGAGKYYEKNPYCCYIGNKIWFQSVSDSFLNKLFGEYYYQITINYKREEPITTDVNYPYRDSEQVINQCGELIDTVGGEIQTEEHYNNQIEMIKQSITQEKSHGK